MPKKPTPARARPRVKKKSPASHERENWQEKYRALDNKYQFLMAEYSNYKKNNLKTMENLRKYEGQRLIQQIITKVVDDFDRALEQNVTEQNLDEFKKGILMIYENLKSILKERGITEINSTGVPFDPAIHSAMDSLPTEEMPPEHIVHIIKKAYCLHDKLIRPAEVIVSRAKTPLSSKKEDKEPGGS